MSSSRFLGFQILSSSSLSGSFSSHRFGPERVWKGGTKREREKGREREGEGAGEGGCGEIRGHGGRETERESVHVFVVVRLSACEREREREKRGRAWERRHSGTRKKRHTGATQTHKETHRRV